MVIDLGDKTVHIVQNARTGQVVAAYTKAIHATQHVLAHRDLPLVVEPVALLDFYSDGRE